LKKVGILLIHGLWEHKGRHDVNASWFKNLNIEPFLVDLPGHGKNVDVFGHIEQWEEVENSIVKAYKLMESYDVKIVFGISFGGQVALHCVLKNIIDPDFLILSAPSLGDNYPQFIKTISKSISKLFPKLRIPSSANKRNLSTDVEVVKDYFNDPLVFRSISAKFGNETIESQKFVNKNISNLKTPTLYLHGDKDSIVPISSGDELSRLANVKFITVFNSKHEILNQDTRPFVLSEIHQWLVKEKII
jgi:alpha-beta hydrolase superfamily lysophospholipase